MADGYKRIITIAPDATADLLSHNVGECHIRPARAGVIGEYAIEVPNTARWRRHADKLVGLFEPREPASEAQLGER